MIRYHTYRFPFKKPFVTAKGSFTHREGLILEGEKQGIRFFGEASPLPGFSGETLDEAERFLAEHRDTIEKLFEQELSLTEFDKLCLNLQAPPPSLRFALSAAMGDFLAQKNHRSLSAYLHPGSHKKIPVNTTLSMDAPDLITLNAVSAWEKGFQTFKIKVGGDVDTELAMLKEIRKALPDANIRIDANGAWKTDEAIGFLNRLQPLQIEYCEQPVPDGDLENLLAVKKNSPVPIAADESARSVADILDIIDHRSADILILKPMLIGSITEFFTIVERAAGSGTGIVVTTSLEGGPARRATAHLAACLKSQPYAHGLATGDLFEHDFFQDKDPIRNGYYVL